LMRPSRRAQRATVCPPLRHARWRKRAAPKRTARRRVEQGMCHANRRKNVDFDGNFHRAPSTGFTACPLFRNRSNNNGRAIIAVEVGTRAHRGCAMTPDEAIALSFATLSDLPRVGLIDRLHADDPHLLDLARLLLPRADAVRIAAARRGIRAVAWNDPSFPSTLLSLPDVPPALWYRGSLEVL